MVPSSTGTGDSKGSFDLPITSPSASTTSASDSGATISKSMGMAREVRSGLDGGLSRSDDAMDGCEGDSHDAMDGRDGETASAVTLVDDLFLREEKTRRMAVAAGERADLMDSASA